MHSKQFLLSWLILQHFRKFNLWQDKYSVTHIPACITLQRWWVWVVLQTDIHNITVSILVVKLYSTCLLLIVVSVVCYYYSAMLRCSATKTMQHIYSYVYINNGCTYTSPDMGIVSVWTATSPSVLLVLFIWQMFAL